QETCRCACPRRVRCARGVVQFGEVRRQLATVELGQRQTPERLVFRSRACQQASGQLVVEAEQGVVVVAQRGFRRTGQGRHVDNQLWLLRRGIDQAIGQYQTTF